MAAVTSYGMRACAAAGVIFTLLGAAGAPALAAAPALIGRGQYLARAGNCAACHTRENGPPFAGGVAFDTPFGRLYSANITPDGATGIGAWSGAAFRDSLRSGLRPDGEHLYPVFPYTAFTKITDEDAAALFAYLKSVPAVRYEPPGNDMSFPFGARWLLGLWNAMFLERGAFAPEAGKSAAWNRGAYLVTALGHCSACHSPRNLLGAERSALAMTGGTHLARVPGGATRAWSAPNLTSDATGLASWSVEEVASYLKGGSNAYAASFGPMNEVIMQGTRFLSDEDLRAMATYLKSLPANAAPRGPSAEPQAMQAGETLYNVNCGTCHEPDGLGAEDAGPRLDRSLVVQASDPATLINSILYAPDPPASATAARAWRPMEAYADKLSDEEIAALATYLRGAWSNRAGAVTAPQVAKQR